MGRTRQGWTLRRPSPNSVWYVRFTLAGRTTERSTGTRDRDAAAREAARIYADCVRREPKRPPKLGRRGGALSLETLIGGWLTWLGSTHAPGTLATWELYARTHWLPHFRETHNLTQALCDAYPRERIAVVQAVTVRKESTALRSFLGWCAENGAIPEPLMVPALPRRAAGTPHPVRRRTAAVAITPEQVEAFLAALPEWSTSKKVDRFPIRARFVVAYETSLRPSTLDRLSSPEHYREGASRLRITAAVDKAKWAREVPLSERARAELDAVCPPKGLIFGRHVYTEHVRAAAFAALPYELAERFAASHLRSARITHLLERQANLPGVQHLAGHRLTSTTARYVKPSFNAAAEALGVELGAPKNSGGRRSAKGGT